MMIESVILDKWQARLRIMGLTALPIMVIMGIAAPRAFFHGYLAAFVFWLQLPLGAGGLLLLHALTGGRWGAQVRGPLVLLVLTTALFVPLFLPIAGGVNQLYAWTGFARNAGGGREAYLNIPFFFTRAGAFLFIWAIGGWIIGRRVAGNDERRQHGGIGAGRASFGLILYVLTVSFAAIDWVGALDAHWYSSIFGLYLLIGQVIAAFAAAILLGLADWRMGVRDERTLRGSPDVLQDLGTLMLAFVSLHAYFAFSQFFIIWNGNLPHEISWYIPRMHGAWGVVTASLMLVHFALPFALLLSRANKRNPRRMIMILLLILGMRLVECTWMVIPAQDQGQLFGVAAVLVCALGIGCAWLWMLTRLLRRWRVGTLALAGRE